VRSYQVIGPILVALVDPKPAVRVAAPVGPLGARTAPVAAVEDEEFTIRVLRDDTDGDVLVVGYPMATVQPVAGGQVRHLVPVALWCPLERWHHDTVRSYSFRAPADLAKREFRLSIDMLLGLALDPKEFSVPLAPGEVTLDNGCRVKVGKLGKSDEGGTIISLRATWDHGVGGTQEKKVDRILARARPTREEMEWLLLLQATGKIRRHRLCGFTVHDEKGKAYDPGLVTNKIVGNGVDFIEGECSLEAHSRNSSLHLRVARVRYTYGQFDLGKAVTLRGTRE